MVFPVSPVTVMAPAFRTIAEAQAWADSVYGYLHTLTRRVDALTVQSRAVQAAAISDLALESLTDPINSPATADALRDDLVANTVAEARTNFTDVQTAINAILAAMRANLVVAE